ncbi:hypothetical protein [Limnobaculum eriocheiris]
MIGPVLSPVLSITLPTSGFAGEIVSIIKSRESDGALTLPTLSS